MCLVVGQKKPIVGRCFSPPGSPGNQGNTKKCIFDFYVLLGILCLCSGLKRRFTDTMLCEIKNILSTANKDLNW